ncbi:secondary thiamine-phosphate synthase enzyme YjbQ [bacterium]|nr:secondary thiamine-phosphate synthase enzyme YjbQ [bacterium]
MDKLSIETKKRNDFVEITEQLSGFIKHSGIEDGILYVYVPHTTCGITINENADPSVEVDILNYLKEVIPENGRYSHREGNSDAHIKSVLVGNSITVFIENGFLMLGTWQGIFLCEFDGPRRREVWLKICKTA